MPLIIEDGTGVTGANSYVSVNDLRAYAQDRGVSFPDAPGSGIDPAIAVFTPFLIRATDYLEQYRRQYVGCEGTHGQPLSWPRKYWDWPTFDTATIPAVLLRAQCQLVLEQMQGIPLFTSLAGYGTGFIPKDANGNAIDVADGRFIVRDKVDVLETEWSEKLLTQAWPLMPAVDALLNTIIEGGVNGFLTGYRI